MEPPNGSGPSVWSFRSFNRIPMRQTVYEFAMDMQAWQYQNGLRVFCLNCIDATRRRADNCSCKLVDSLGTLTSLGDGILFTHTRQTDRCFRCMHRRTARAKACDLYVTALRPVDASRGVDLSIALECRRLRCDRQWHVVDGLETERPARE